MSDMVDRESAISSLAEAWIAEDSTDEDAEVPEDQEAEEEEGSEPGEGEEEPTEAGQDEEAPQDEEAEKEETKGYLAEDEMEKVVRLKSGEEVPVSELVAGYMKDADYRRKTQALAEERRALESERLSVAQAVQEFRHRAEDALWFASAYEQMVRTNPWLGEFTAALMRNDVEQAQALAQQAASWNPVRFQGLGEQGFGPQPTRDPRVDQLLAEQLAEKLRQEWEEIQGEDPEADLDAVIATARERNLRSLKEAYLLTYQDRLMQRAEKVGFEKAMREVKRGAKSPTSMKPGKPKQEAQRPKLPRGATVAQQMAYAYKYGK